MPLRARFIRVVAETAGMMHEYSLELKKKIPARAAWLRPFVVGKFLSKQGRPE